VDRELNDIEADAIKRFKENDKEIVIFSSKIYLLTSSIG